MNLLFTLLIYLLILGVIYWVITLIPLPPPFKTVALVIFAVIVIFLLFGLLTGGMGLPALR
jgi:heme A synthase